MIVASFYVHHYSIIIYNLQEFISCCTAPGFCRNNNLHYRTAAKTTAKRRQEKAKPTNGVPGCPRAHILQAPPGCKVYSALYRPGNRLTEQMEPYAQQLEILRHNEKALRSNTHQAQLTAQIVQNESTTLIHQLRDYQDFMDSIPEELRKELMERYEQKQGEQTQSLRL
jgi:hypothetical protein